MTSATQLQSKPSEFNYGKVYTLYNIRPTGEEIQYTFRDNHSNKVQKNFESVSQADQWISTCKNESVPDYEKFYQHNTS